MALLAGFYETSMEEENPGEQEFRRIQEAKLREENRHDKEAQAKKADEKRAKKRKESDLPGMIMQINRLNDPEMTRKRTKLSLPAPQVTAWRSACHLLSS